jgi:hypothetical protein
VALRSGIPASRAFSKHTIGGHIRIFNMLFANVGAIVWCVFGVHRCGVSLSKVQRKKRAVRPVAAGTRPGR